MTPDTLRRRWRSLLFLPADNAKLIEKAHLRGADAVILDLEDAIPLDAKPAARAALPERIGLLAGRGADVLVRINHDPDMLDADLDAAVQPGVKAVVVPKTEAAEELAGIAAMVAAREQARGLPEGAIGLVALIESPAALFRLAEIAAAPRLAGLALGTEDFSLSLGVPPTPACLTLPCQMLALAAAAHGVMALAMPASIAGFRDLVVYRQGATTARAIGATGALCIHPTQVPVLNEAFAPTEAERQWAAAIVAAWEKAEAEGSGVATVGGEMIDRPVVARARAILSASVGSGA